MKIIENYIILKFEKELSTYCVKSNAFESVCLLRNSSGQWLKSDWSCPLCPPVLARAHIGPRRCVLTERFLSRMELREKSWEKLTFSFSLLFFFPVPHFPEQASLYHILNKWLLEVTDLAPHSPTVMDPTSKHAGFGEFLTSWLGYDDH